MRKLSVTTLLVLLIVFLGRFARDGAVLGQAALQPPAKAAAQAAQTAAVAPSTISSNAPASTSGMPGPAPLIANIEHRQTASLNGPWHYIVDPYNTGYWDYRHQPRKDGYFERAVPKSKSDLVEYDFDKSDTIIVPGDWNTQQKQLYYYEGPLWYERSFTYHKPAGPRVFIAVGAAN